MVNEHKRKGWLQEQNLLMVLAECYCVIKKIPFRLLLELHNTPVHPTTLDHLHPNAEVLFLLTHAHIHYIITSLLKPMDQGVIASFKAYYFLYYRKLYYNFLKVIL